MIFLGGGVGARLGRCGCAAGEDLRVGRTSLSAFCPCLCGRRARPPLPLAAPPATPPTPPGAGLPLLSTPCPRYTASHAAPPPLKMGCMRTTALALLAAAAVVALSATPASAIVDAEKTVFTSFIIPNDTDGKPVSVAGSGGGAEGGGARWRAVLFVFFLGKKKRVRGKKKTGASLSSSSCVSTHVRAERLARPCRRPPGPSWSVSGFFYGGRLIAGAAGRAPRRPPRPPKNNHSGPGECGRGPAPPPRTPPPVVAPVTHLGSSRRGPRPARWVSGLLKTSAWGVGGGEEGGPGRGARAGAHTLFFLPLHAAARAPLPMSAVPPSLRPFRPSAPRPPAT